MAFESDWVFLRAALPDLRDYILSSDIYWTLRPPARSPGGVRIPQLTLGNLALSQARLAALPLSDPQKAELAELSGKIQQVREEWRSNWGLKAAREYSSRLNLWQQYIGELRGDVGQKAPVYANEVRMRAILQLLRSERVEPVPPNEEDLLRMLDQILRGLTRPGPFVWEGELADGFSREDFWFLYVAFQV